MTNPNNNTNYIDFLTKCNTDNTPKFEFNYGITKLVKVIDVYDGDTITVAMSIHPDNNNEDVSMIYKFNIRMYGYNTEEIRQPKNDPDREDKKAYAIYQRDWLREQILNKIVILECLGYDKYGRILGKVFLDQEKTKCINDIIVDLNIAPKYIP